MNKLILIIALLILHSVAAQDSAIEFNTVEDAINYAIENNHNLSKSRIDQEIILAQISEVKGRALPQVNVNGQFSDNYSLQQQLLPAEIFGGEPGTTVEVAFGNRYQFTGGLSVQQQLLNFQLFSSIKSTAALKELRNLQTLETTQDLIINVVQTYIQIQVFEKQVALLEQNYERTDNLIELSDYKLKEGIIKKLDVNQLMVNRSNLKTQIEDAEFGKNQQLRLFKVLLALPLDSEVLLKEQLEDRPAAQLNEELTLNANLQYQQLEKSIELSVLDQKLVRSEYLPSLNAFWNYNYLGQANEFGFSGDAYQDQFSGIWGLAATIPIFDGFQRGKRLKQKKLETDKLEKDREQLVLNMEKEFNDAKEQLLLSTIQIESQNSNMNLAQENYDGIKMSYTEGVADLTELLDSEFALREAQSNYLNALLQSKVSELALLRSSGQLSQLISQPINN